MESSKYLGWRSRYQSILSMKMAMDIKGLAAVDDNSHVTLIKSALAIKIW